MADTLSDSVTSQFDHPRGITGRLAGLFMAFTNRDMHRAALELMEIEPADVALEIGFGSGLLIAGLTERIATGFVAGIDVSDAMVRQASRRNRVALRNGRIELLQASILAIPYPDGMFDKVYSLNTVHLWPEPESNLREVSRVLRPGGWLILGMRRRDPRGRFTGRAGPELDEIAGLIDALARAGYEQITERQSRADRGRAVFITARSPAPEAGSPKDAS
jgi:ubiquinone/menaquinone biosynthesis C-methylase UbiE